MNVAVDRDPRPAPPLRRVIAKHPSGAFLLMVLAVNVVLSVPPYLTRRDLLPFDQAPYDWLGHIVGLALPAFIVTWAVAGRAGVQDLRRRCLRWRVGVRPYLFALLIVPVATILFASFFYGTEPASRIAERWTSLFTDAIPHLIVIVAFSNTFEEIGWTGFFLDRMQKRFSPMKAAFVTGLVFALFHVPSYIVEEGLAVAPLLFAILLLPQIASRIIAAWLYNTTARSVLLVGLFHCAHNVTAAEISHEFIPGPRDELYFFIGVGVLIIAAAIAIFTKGRLGYEHADASA